MYGYGSPYPLDLRSQKGTKLQEGTESGPRTNPDIWVWLAVPCRFAAQVTKGHEITRGGRKRSPYKFPCTGMARRTLWICGSGHKRGRNYKRGPQAVPVQIPMYGYGSPYPVDLRLRSQRGTKLQEGTASGPRTNPDVRVWLAVPSGFAAQITKGHKIAGEGTASGPRTNSDRSINKWELLGGSRSRGAITRATASIFKEREKG
jgi:hypothetical protein